MMAISWTPPPQSVELKAGDGIKELTFFNDMKPGMRLIKVDSADPSKVIPNAVFEIKSVAGDYGPEEFTTDENGEIDLSHLPAGAYVVTEKSCPGYIIDEAQRIIQLDPNENAQFVFTNSIKPSFQLIKLSADGSRLAGVTFRIAKSRMETTTLTVPPIPGRDPDCGSGAGGVLRQGNRYGGRPHLRPHRIPR